MTSYRDVFDERWFAHRERSTSIGGVCGAVVAMGWFLYHLVSNGEWRWDLLSVGIVMVLVKLALMTWYRVTH